MVTVVGDDKPINEYPRKAIVPIARLLLFFILISPVDVMPATVPIKFVADVKETAPPVLNAR